MLSENYSCTAQRMLAPGNGSGTDVLACFSRERDTPRLANHHREIPTTSSVITLDGLPKPRFLRVSKPNRCDDRGFSWVGGVRERESDCGSGTHTDQLSGPTRHTIAPTQPPHLKILGSWNLARMFASGAGGRQIGLAEIGTDEEQRLAGELRGRV